jgi:hypothetical protein
MTSLFTLPLYLGSLICTALVTPDGFWLANGLGGKKILILVKRICCNLTQTKTPLWVK